jgi:hypothetical protein
LRLPAAPLELELEPPPLAAPPTAGLGPLVLPQPSSSNAASSGDQSGRNKPPTLTRFITLGKRGRLNAEARRHRYGLGHPSPVT